MRLEHLTKNGPLRVDVPFVVRRIVRLILNSLAKGRASALLGREPTVVQPER